MAAEIDFPAILPCGIREGYALELVQPFARTEMASGRAKQRQTFDNVPEMATVSWIFTPQEGMFFESWFRYTIRNGTDWFNVDLRTTMDGRDDPGVSSYECRFTSVYKKAPEGAYDWRFTANLELRYRETLDEEWLEFPEYVLESSLIDIAMNREWPEE